MTDTPPQHAAVPRKGRVLVVSAPSGAGKHSVLERVLAEVPDLAYSVSATTRAPRAGEADGREYYFMPRAEFEKRAAAGEFVEWAEVHGNLYGTLRSELDRLLGSGKDVVLEVDIQGMHHLLAQGLDLTTIFVEPPSMAELERRLTRRGSESPESIALRLRNAQAEMAARDRYDFVVVNDDLDAAVAAFKDIVEQTRKNPA